SGPASVASLQYHSLSAFFFGCASVQLHLHSFPTRRSSDLLAARRAGGLPAVRADVRDHLGSAAQDHRHRSARVRPMMRRVLQVLLVTLFVLTARSVAAQQSASELLALGERAYQNLDYDQAAALLRRGLARATGDTFSTGERLQALTYLGATELFRDRRD